MRIVFWQAILSHLQIPYIKRLSRDNLIIKVFLVVTEQLDEERRQLGWNSDYSFDTIELIISPTRDQINEICSWRKTIHYFSGINYDEIGKTAVKELVRSGKSFGLISENVDLRGHRSISRRLFSFFKERKYKNNVHSVFCIGVNAMKWYKECGYSEKLLFGFGYTTEPKYDLLVNEHQKEVVKFVFVGQLINRKGVDLMIKSFSEFGKRNLWKLDIIGSGNMLNEYITLTNELQLNDNVSFLGSKPNTEIGNLLKGYDVLILPSRRDGWGAVINEALQYGLFIICSNQCGACELIHSDTNNGLVFNIKKVNSELPILLSTVCETNFIFLSDERRNQRIKWAENKIHPEVIANYFISVLKHLNNRHSFPKLPW